MASKISVMSWWSVLLVKYKDKSKKTYVCTV